MKADSLHDRDEFDLLLACIRGEAEGEALFGKLAVASVIRNRVLDKRWPDTYKEVVLQPAQFSCFLPEYLRPEIFKPERGELWWRECKLAAYAIYHNWVRDITQGANHYHDISIADDLPSWAEGRHPIFRYGALWFYNL